MLINERPQRSPLITRLDKRLVNNDTLAAELLIQSVAMSDTEMLSTCASVHLTNNNKNNINSGGRNNINFPHCRENISAAYFLFKSRGPDRNSKLPFVGYYLFGLTDCKALDYPIPLISQFTDFNYFLIILISRINLLYSNKNKR